MSVAIRRIPDSARRDVAFAALTLALFLAVTLAFPGFATPRSVAGLLDDTAILIMLALGQMLVIMGRVSHRETAPLAVFHQDVDVLAGEKLQPLVGR